MWVLNTLVLLSVAILWASVSCENPIDYSKRGSGCNGFVAAGPYVHPDEYNKCFTANISEYKRILDSAYPLGTHVKVDFISNRNYVEVTENNAYISVTYINVTGVVSHYLHFYVFDLYSTSGVMRRLWGDLWKKCIRHGDTIMIGPFSKGQNVGFVLENTARDSVYEYYSNAEYNHCSWVKFNSTTSIMGFEDGGLERDFVMYDADYTDIIISLKSEKIRLPDGILQYDGKYIDKCYAVIPKDAIHNNGESWALLDNERISCLCGRYLPLGWDIAPYDEESRQIIEKHYSSFMVVVRSHDGQYCVKKESSYSVVDVRKKNNCYYVPCGMVILVKGSSVLENRCGRFLTNDIVGESVYPARVDFYPEIASDKLVFSVTKRKGADFLLHIYVVISKKAVRNINEFVEDFTKFSGAHAESTFILVIPKDKVVLGTPRSRPEDFVNDVINYLRSDQKDSVRVDCRFYWSFLSSFKRGLYNSVLFSYISDRVACSGMKRMQAEKNIFIVESSRTSVFEGFNYFDGIYECNIYCARKVNLYKVLIESRGYSLDPDVDVLNNDISVNVKNLADQSRNVYFPGIGKCTVNVYKNTPPYITRAIRLSGKDNENITFSVKGHAEDAQNNSLRVVFHSFIGPGNIYVGEDLLELNKEYLENENYKYVPNRESYYRVIGFEWSVNDGCASSPRQKSRISIAPFYDTPVARDFKVEIKQNSTKYVNFSDAIKDEYGKYSWPYCISIVGDDKVNFSGNYDREYDCFTGIFLNVSLGNIPPNNYTYEYRSKNRNGISSMPGKLIIDAILSPKATLVSLERHVYSSGEQNIPFNIFDINNPKANITSVDISVGNESMKSECGNENMKSKCENEHANNSAIIQRICCRNDVVEVIMDLGTGTEDKEFNLTFILENSYNITGKTPIFIQRSNLKKPNMTVEPSKGGFIQGTKECSEVIKFKGIDNQEGDYARKYTFVFSGPEGMDFKVFASGGNDRTEVDASKNYTVSSFSESIAYSFWICPASASYGIFNIAGYYFVGGEYVYDKNTFTLDVECDPIPPTSNNQDIETNQNNAVKIRVNSSVERPKGAGRILNFTYFSGGHDCSLMNAGSVVSVNDTFHVDGLDGSIEFEFVPSSNYFGVVTYWYILCIDGYPNKCSSEYRININVVFENNPPYSEDKMFTTLKNKLLVFTLNGSDPDVRDAGDLTLEIVEFFPKIDEINGKLCLDMDLKNCLSGKGTTKLYNADEITFYYMPDNDFFVVGNAALKFSFKYCDTSEEYSDVYWCYIHVDPLNLPPNYTGRTAFEIDQDAEWEFPLMDNILVERPDDSAIVSMVNPPGRGNFRIVLGKKETNSNEIDKYPCDFDHMYYTPQSYDWGGNFTSFTIRVTSRINNNSNDYNIKISVRHTFRQPTIKLCNESINIDRTSALATHFEIHSDSELPENLKLRLDSYSYYHKNWKVQSCKRLANGTLECGENVNPELLRNVELTPSYVVNEHCNTIENMRDNLVAKSFSFNGCHAVFILRFEVGNSSFGIPFAKFVSKPIGVISGDSCISTININPIDSPPQIQGPKDIYTKLKTNIRLADKDGNVVVVSDPFSVSQSGELWIFVEEGNVHINVKNYPLCMFVNSTGTRDIIFTDSEYNTLLCKDKISELNLLMEQLVTSFSGNRFVLNVTISDVGDKSKGNSHPLTSSILVRVKYEPTRKGVNIALVASLGTVFGILALIGAAYLMFRSKPPKADYFENDEQIVMAQENPLFKPATSSFTNPGFKPAH